jgi:hypothetical protein
VTSAWENEEGGQTTTTTPTANAADEGDVGRNGKRPVSRDDKARKKGGKQKGSKKRSEPATKPTKSVSTVLVEFARERYDLGVSNAGESYAIPKEGPHVVLMLRGGRTSLRAQLAREYYQRTGKTARQQALADALLTIEGLASEADPMELHMRVADHDGALFLDLGDSTGRCVRITGDGWTVEDRPPVLFKRTPLTGSLPEPVRGGNLEELWAWLNVTEEDRPSVAGWSVATLIPHIPHPVLNLDGEQGSGKTTAAKALVLVSDPSPVPTRKPPRDAESWVTAAAGSWVVGLDNLSAIPDWLSDSLCRAVTGEGDVRRKLYTDGDLTVFAYRRCVVLTGIDLGAVNGDLADRLLSIHLDVIADEERREEGELWPGWDDAHPRILGAILDLAARVASLAPSVVLPTKPRMADFARILACVDQVLGTNGLERYRQQQGALATEALTADLFITAIGERLGTEEFRGTSADLLTMLTPADEPWRRPAGWPADPRRVTQLLRRQAPTMRKAGWMVSQDDGHNKRHAVIWTVGSPQTEKARVGGSPDSPPSSSQVRAGETTATHVNTTPTANSPDSPNRTQARQEAGILPAETSQASPASQASGPPPSVRSEADGETGEKLARLRSDPASHRRWKLLAHCNSEQEATVHCKLLADRYPDFRFRDAELADGGCWGIGVLYEGVES